MINQSQKRQLNGWQSTEFVARWLIVGKYFAQTLNAELSLITKERFASNIKNTKK
jgi:hypothetical protein